MGYMKHIMGYIMDDNPNYFQNSNSAHPGTNICNQYTKKHFRSIFFEISNTSVEKSLIYLLSILFMVSGFLLFIYGLFMKHLYQFVMSFIFLISGFILDSFLDDIEIQADKNP